MPKHIPKTLVPSNLNVVYGDKLQSRTHLNDVKLQVLKFDPYVSITKTR